MDRARIARRGAILRETGRIELLREWALPDGPVALEPVAEVSASAPVGDGELVADSEAIADPESVATGALVAEGELVAEPETAEPVHVRSGRPQRATDAYGATEPGTRRIDTIG